MCIWQEWEGKGIGERIPRGTIEDVMRNSASKLGGDGTEDLRMARWAIAGGRVVNLVGQL